MSPSSSLSPSASASPSTGAPTDNYDVELFDQNGLDVLETLGLNRDVATAERAVLVYPTTTIHPYVDEIDALTLRISNNLVANAQVVIDLYYALGA